MKPDVWLRGPAEGFPHTLMPTARALLQAREDPRREVPDLTEAELWVRPGGAASIGFHVRYVAGGIDRLLTYASGGALDEVQLRVLAEEKEPGDPPANAAALVDGACAPIDQALTTMWALPSDDVFAERFVGRSRLSSTVLGLLFIWPSTRPGTWDSSSPPRRSYAASISLRCVTRCAALEARCIGIDKQGNAAPRQRCARPSNERRYIHDPHVCAHPDAPRERHDHPSHQPRERVRS